MTRHVFTFLATFVLGALIALAARTAFHQPHAAPAAADHVPAPAAPPAAGDHSHQAAKPPAAATPAVAAKPPVNTVCAICGMNVDPRLPTAEYQGRRSVSAAGCVRRNSRPTPTNTARPTCATR